MGETGWIGAVMHVQFASQFVDGLHLIDLDDGADLGD